MKDTSASQAIPTKALIIFTGLQMLDVATTLSGLARQGAFEANPFMRHCIESFGPVPGLLAAKILMVGIILGFIVSRMNPVKALRLVNVFFTGLVLWNLGIMTIRYCTM